MADRYWVGGGSSTNWSATGNTNWASSSGGANNQSVPGTGDNVFFDANSGAGASVLSASQSIGTLDMSNASISGLTHNNSVTLTVDGAGGTFKLATGKYTSAGSGSNITFTGAGTFNFTTGGATIQGTLQINGASAVVVMQDAFVGNATGHIVLTIGQFDANDFNITGGIILSSSNTNTRTVSMGSGTWTSLLTSGAFWDTGTTTNLTFNKETANIVCGVAGTNSSLTFTPGTLTLNQLTINAANSSIDHLINFGASAFTLSHLNVGAGNRLVLGSNITVSNAFTWVGSAARPIALTSSAGTTARTITVSSGNASLDWGFLAGSTISGGSPVATNTFNGGNNSGWTITGPSGAKIIGG